MQLTLKSPSEYTNPCVKLYVQNIDPPLIRNEEIIPESSLSSDPISINNVSLNLLVQFSFSKICTSSSLLSGLVMKWSIPAAIACRLKEASSQAVQQQMKGISSSPSIGLLQKSLLIRMATSGPSNSGILQSSSIILYIQALPILISSIRSCIMFRALLPLNAVSTFTLSYFSIAVTTSMLQASSSTTRISGCESKVLLGVLLALLLIAGVVFFLEANRLSTDSSNSSLSGIKFCESD